MPGSPYKQCYFCKNQVNDYISHIRSHGVEKNSAFLLNFYTEGNTLLDIKDKIEKNSGKVKHFFRNMNKKEEIFRQMLRHYRRLKRKFGSAPNEVQNAENRASEVSLKNKVPKSCMFCKSTAYNIVRHLKTHNISENSAYLLSYYEKGDTLLDLQNKISSRSKGYTKIVNKKSSFRQMILDYERLKSQNNEEDDDSKKMNEAHTNERIKACMFCNTKVRKIYQHLKMHGVRDSSAFLLQFYEDGDTLQDIQNKLEKDVGRIKNCQKKLMNMKCFQQMLRDYKRLCNEYEENNDKLEKIGEPLINENSNTCMFCNEKVINMLRHLKTHDIPDSSAFLLSFYEDGDTLLDMQKKIEKKMNRSTNFHKKMIDEDCFKQMLLDRERLLNKYDEKHEQENFNNQPKKSENHDLQVSADSNYLQDIIAELKQTIDKLLTCISKSEKVNKTNNLGQICSTQTDAEGSVKDVGSQTFQREQKHAETQIISKNIGIQTFQRDQKHAESQTITINAGVQTLPREQKHAETQIIAIEIGTQTNFVEKKHAETGTGKEQDQFATIENNANSKCSETGQQLMSEREIVTKEQRFIELETEIIKMRLELARIKEKDKEIGKHAIPSLEEERLFEPERCQKQNVSINSIPAASIVAVYTVQEEKNETPQKSISRSASDVPIRRGRSGGLSPSITPFDRSMRAPESTAIVAVKSRDTCRSLDTRKGKSESMLMSPSDNKISRISSETNTSMNSGKPKIEQSSQDMVSVISVDSVDTDINIKSEPVVTSCEKPPPKISLHSWVSMLDKVLFPSESTENRHRSARDIKMLEKVFENLKMCLGYFLPPEWPVGKAAIYTLTPKDLADFPLDKFFDKYKQGLRKLFTNFQSETARSNEKLINLRKNVVSVLQILNVNGGVQSSLSLDDEVDRILNDFLDSKK